MKITLIILSVVVLGNSSFCFSQCLSSVNGSCNTGPYDCQTLDPIFSTPGMLATGYSPVQLRTALSMSTNTNFKMSRTFAPFTCSVYYNATGFTYVYDVLGKFVSNDYIYKRYTITQPHFQITIRVSITFVGVWSGNDHLNLYTFDGTTANNYQLRYSCTDAGVNYTQTICSNVGNNVDCVLSFYQTFNHNSTYLLVNFSSLTNIKDPNVQYWSLLDLNIFTANCNSLCASCFTSNSTLTCTSCVASSFLTGNICGSCAPGTFQLPNSNSLLGGYCVTTCPQGYYNTSTVCVACAAGCLACTALDCTTTANSGAQYSLWQDKMALWIVIIALGVLMIAGIIWRIFSSRPKAVNQQHQRIMSQLNETKQAEDKVTEQVHRSNEKNKHMQYIDYHDNVLELSPRKRKRQERDLNRSNININF